MSPASPIADLTYRGYDGPLDAPDYRWWAIAKMMIRHAIKKKWAWGGFAASFFYYVAMIFILFIFDSLASNATPMGGGGAPPINPAQEFLNRINWPDQFLHGFSFGQIPFLIVVLVLGAGTIANDSRANALLVYLSKPCTKLDYLLGKWLGVFIPVLFAMGVPALVFFAYGAMSYRGEGFFSDDPWLILKLLALFPIAAAFNTSLIIGFSSFFNQGRLAGATFAGLYFLSNFFTQLMKIPFMESDNDEVPRTILSLAGKLFYCSIDGVNIGLAKAILGRAGTPPFGIPMREPAIPPPPAWFIYPVVVIVIVLGMLIAWRRVRAVEVVG